MADIVFNVAAGRVGEYVNRVLNNDPASSALVVVVIDVNGVTDAALKDLDTLSEVLATAANEVTNTGYARRALDAADGLAWTVTDASDKAEARVDAQTWDNVAAGDGWGKLLVCYDPDTGAGTDAAIVPLVALDFVVTPDGSDITWQPDASGFFRATT